MPELDKDQLEAIVRHSFTVYQAWKNCIECQYNQYLCRDHTDTLEPMFEVWGYTEGLDVQDMSIQDEFQE